MEELNEQTNKQWGIDKRIPVALILVVAMQTLGFTWGAASLNSAVNSNGKSIMQLERDIEVLSTKLDDRVDGLQGEHISVREFKRMEDQLAEIERRLLEVEKKVYK